MINVATKTRIVPAIDLAAFANEHLLYEAQMFVGARELLRSARMQFEINAGIELCALHLRNLVDFFYLQSPKPDDIIAADYVPNWENKRPVASVLLDSARSRANKEAAHLTTKRIAGVQPGKAWNFDSLSEELRPVIAAFLSNTESHGLSSITVSELRKI